MKLNIKTIMQSIYIFNVILILALSSCLVVDPIDHVGDTDFSVRAPFSFDIPVKNQHHIEIEGINGSITITGKPGISTAQIWGEKIVASDNYEDAEAHLQYLEVQISDKTDKISIETDQPTVTYGRSYQVIYNAIIPDDWDVAIENVNGKVVIDSLNGDVAVGLVNGDVVLTYISGNVAVGVTNGTVYGKINLPTSGFCTINTVNGQIQLSIPQTTSAKLGAKVTNGTVSVSNLTLNNMVSAQNYLSGVLGSGQGTITVETVNGSIKVNGF